MDWTKDNALTQQYDSYKVQAVINEINGVDHSGKNWVGTPAIFGMNFQTVSTAQKLPTSNGLTGGYLADGVTPGPLLARALDYINANVGSMAAAIKSSHLDPDTVIILSAKRGQSPQTPSALTRIPDGPTVAALNAARAVAHPTSSAPLVAFSMDDDGMLMWLNYRSDAATSFAKNFLLHNSGTGNDINGNPKPYSASGLKTIFAGPDAAAYFHIAPGDSRVPDIFRHQPVRHGLHRGHRNDRRARRGQPARPQRSTGCLRRRGWGAPGQRIVGRNHPRSLRRSSGCSASTRMICRQSRWSTPEHCRSAISHLSLGGAAATPAVPTSGRSSIE